MTQTQSRPLSPDTEGNTTKLQQQKQIKKTITSVVPEYINLLTAEEIRRLSNEEPMLMQEGEEREYALELNKMNQEIKDLYDKSKRSFWIPEEVDLTDDRKDFNRLTPKEQHLLKTVLAFFLRADNQIIENHATVFMREVRHNEMRLFLSIQLAIEAIHSEMYVILFDYFIPDPEERKRYLNAIENFPGVQVKYQWLNEFQNTAKYHFGQRNFAFVISEGLFFSASFSVIFWFRSRGLLPGLSMSNDLTSRDEGMHVEAATLVASRLQALRLTEAEAHALMTKALEIEHLYIDDIAPDSMEGMNADLLKQYSNYVADWTLEKCGFPKLTNQKNPFHFMNLIGIEGKTNFFERRNGDYSKLRTSITEEKKEAGGHVDHSFSGELDW
jgi:ribonucleoside-diphosphate reductase beta chain